MCGNASRRSALSIRYAASGLSHLPSMCMHRRSLRMKVCAPPITICWGKAFPMTHLITRRGFEAMIIKNGNIVEDDWNVLRLSADDTPEGAVSYTHLRAHE